MVWWCLVVKSRPFDWSSLGRWKFPLANWPFLWPNLRGPPTATSRSKERFRATWRDLARKRSPRIVAGKDQPNFQWENMGWPSVNDRRTGSSSKQTVIIRDVGTSTAWLKPNSSHHMWSVQNPERRGITPYNSQSTGLLVTAQLLDGWTISIH